MSEETKPTRIENEKHEQFARCIAVGNHPAMCYKVIGFPEESAAAYTLANSPEVRRRAEEFFAFRYPSKYRKEGYKHCTDKKCQF